MISLLDANVLIALFDEVHLHHKVAHAWLAKNRDQGWATCPLTDISRRLWNATASSDHTFWEDSVRVCDPQIIAHDQLLSSKHLTDLYLLALATSFGGRLVTFDRRFPTAAVLTATAENLVIL